MPRYVVLVNWTDQGIRNVKQTIERTDHGGEVAKKYGLNLEKAYWTVGAYDMVSIFEAPDTAIEGFTFLQVLQGKTKSRRADSNRRPTLSTSNK